MDRVLKFFRNKYVSAFCILYGACVVTYYAFDWTRKLLS